MDVWQINEICKQQGQCLEWQYLTITDLYGNTLKIATERGIDRWLLSISHTPAYATASAIALGREELNLKY